MAPSIGRHTRFAPGTRAYCSQNVNTGNHRTDNRQHRTRLRHGLQQQLGQLRLVANYRLAPRYTPYRSGQIRKHHAYQLDASILKTTKIGATAPAQLGFEVFNLFNHNYFGRDDFNTDPNSANFGSVFPSQVSTQNMLPRQIQVRFKFNW